MALNSPNAFNFSPIINYLALPLSVLILCLIYASSSSPTNLQADDKEPVGGAALSFGRMLVNSASLFIKRTFRLSLSLSSFFIIFAALS